MQFSYSLIAACLLGAAWAQQYTTPVPILKQINRHNEDGSYSYGYEAADGSFKIETKYQTGEVYGKYGYVDDLGKVREVEYGASRRGFEPAGNDINVAPPTLTNNPQALPPLPEGQEDDGQYREDPSIYYKDERYNKPAQNQQVYRPQEQHRQAYQQPAYQPQYQQQPYQQQTYQQSYQQPSYYQPQPYQQATYQQPAYQPYRPAFNQQSYLNSAQLATHPAVKNIDIFSGSYSVDYKKK
ncbi:cuticular protein 97Eb [Rhodnius prolixus]|uniref:Putative cuticular protein 97eb n=1 Tax=Rhodnius prolixus TaxID=13249 RepID=R4FKD0_RHOPR